MLIRSPAVCRRAWVRFLRREGCTLAEIARALGITEFEAAQLSGRVRPLTMPATRAKGARA